MSVEIVNRLKELLMGDPKAEDPRKQIGFLKANNLSVEQFAREVGVTRTSVYFYIKDRSRPTVDTLRKICDRVGISLAEGYEYCTPRTTGRQPKNA